MREMNTRQGAGAEVVGTVSIFDHLLVPTRVRGNILPLLLLLLLMLPFEEIVEELKLCGCDGGEDQEDEKGWGQ